MEHVSDTDLYAYDGEPFITIDVPNLYRHTMVNTRWWLKMVPK